MSKDNLKENAWIMALSLGMIPALLSAVSDRSGRSIKAGGRGSKKHAPESIFLPGKSAVTLDHEISIAIESTQSKATE